MSKVNALEGMTMESEVVGTVMRTELKDQAGWHVMEAMSTIKDEPFAKAYAIRRNHDTIYKARGWDE